jgi:hypothetical protein
LSPSFYRRFDDVLARAQFDHPLSGASIVNADFQLRVSQQADRRLRSFP